MGGSAMLKRQTAVFLSLFVLLILIGLTLNLNTTHAQEFGTNWSGTFFNSPNLTGTGVPVTGINGLNFNWGTGSPIINGVAVPGIGIDNFSARFTSSQNFNAG